MADNFKSLDEIARFHGRSKTAVFKWTKHPEWPCHGKSYNKAKIRRFVRTVIDKKEDGGATSAAAVHADGDAESEKEDALAGLSPERRAKLELVIERSLLLRFEREMKLGQFVSREDVEQGRVERVQAVVSSMRNIRLLALKLLGKDLVQMETILETWAKGVCNSFAQGNIPPDP